MMRTGVDVGRLVAVGFGVLVGAGVQVGNMRMRGVAVCGMIVAEGNNIGVDVGDGEQAYSKNNTTTVRRVSRLMIDLPCLHE